MSKKQSYRRSPLIRFLGVTTILAGLAYPAVSAAADEVAAPVAAADADAAGLGEIVVTATRSAESIQKVPISMQALGSDTLEQRQVNGLSDFAALIPSVSFAGIGPGRSTAYFRGIVPAGGNYASVGYYLDDMPITGTSVPDIHIYDMERIEALSGPQGTLYGAGSLAGTIRMITAKPKLDKFEFGYDVEGNKYGEGAFGGQIESYINVPVSDTIAVRAMGYYRADGGYVDNTPNNGKLNDGSSATLTLGDNNPATSYTLDNTAFAKDDYNTIREYGGRLQILWQPTDGWEITPQITAQRQISKGYFGYDPRVGDLEVHDYDLTRQDDKWYQAALSIHGHIGDWDLVSATGYFNRKTNLRNDYTYYTVTYDSFGAGNENYLQFFDKSGCTGSGATLKCSTLISPMQYYHGSQSRKKFTQEVRLTTPKSWPFDLTIGGFYQKQKQNSESSYATHGLDDIMGYTRAGGGDSNPAGFGIPVANGGTMVLGTPAVRGDAFYYSNTDQLYHDYAVFAEAHYDITPTLKITGGLRYFWTDFQTAGFSGVMSSATALGCTTPLADGPLTCLNSNPLDPDNIGRYKENGETHKIALNWQVAPSKMIYANYSTGFRPGGYNRPLRIRSTGQLATIAPFESETLTNYEIGFKTTWNNIFRLNAAVYYEKWNNIQYSVVVSGAQGAGMTGNAGKAEVKGIEYDADLRLGKITISTSGAYNDAKLAGNFCNFQYDTTAGAITQLSSCTVGATFGTPAVAEVAAIDGTRLPRQPKFKGTTSIRYDTELGEYAGFLMGSVNYQTNATQNLNTLSNNYLTCGGTTADAEAADDAGTVCTTSGFASFDFTAGIKKDNWSLSFFIQNAFDKRGELTRNTFCSITFCSGSARTFPIKPQFFGMRFGQKF